jgi:hypothetical protein
LLANLLSLGKARTQSASSSPTGSSHRDTETRRIEIDGNSVSLCLCGLFLSEFSPFLGGLADAPAKAQ